MGNKVGQKGQVVVAKEIRDRLGVKPGWVALQRLVEDHVEIFFLAPEHRRCLKGCLQEYLYDGAGQDLTWPEIQHLAWSEAAREQELQETAAGDGLP